MSVKLPEIRPKASSGRVSHFANKGGAGDSQNPQDNSGSHDKTISVPSAHITDKILSAPHRNSNSGGQSDRLISPKKVSKEDSARRIEEALLI